ncbi:unnamed protein product [Moneuplotes crassus]|uniref:Uncharacterized protein n=1 Tax=Euplotes crassus TaxID=5936 RepID=A0AAD1XQL2_EUPCR|nr:unnamed protein product [Moneuplotes crassus]
MSCIIATAGYDQCIKFWDLNNCTRSIPFTDSAVNKIIVSPDKDYLGVAAHTQLHLYKIEGFSQKPDKTYLDNKTNITDLGFEKDCKWLFTSSEDGILQIFDYRAEGFQMKYENSCCINSAILQPLQSEIYFGDDKGTIGIWDLVKNEPRILQEDPEQVAIRSIDITVEGSKLCAANSEGMVFVRNLNDKGEYVLIEDIEAHIDSYILKCKFSRCGQFIATCSSDRTLKIWECDDENSYEEIQELTGHTGWVWDCAFTVNSDYLVSVSSDAILKIWEVESGDLRRVLKGHAKGITTLAFSDY